MSRREHTRIRVVCGGLLGDQPWGRQEEAASGCRIQDMVVQGCSGARLAVLSSPWVLLGLGANSSTSPQGSDFGSRGSPAPRPPPPPGTCIPLQGRAGLHPAGKWAPGQGGGVQRPHTSSHVAPGAAKIIKSLLSRVWESAGEQSGHWDAGKGQIRYRERNSRGSREGKSPPRSLHWAPTPFISYRESRGVKPTPKALPPAPPSCNTSRLLPPHTWAPEAGWGGHFFGPLFGLTTCWAPFTSSAQGGLRPWCYTLFLQLESELQSSGHG